MSRNRRDRILQIVLTDASFTPNRSRGSEFGSGGIHCDRKLMVDTSGEALGPITIEHILPRNHGGDNSVTNLALACKRCNNVKGYRLDHLPLSDPRLARSIEQLRKVRKERWREADEAPDPYDVHG